ncbi:unnamed protein product [Phaedon cochleariae]|uniref:Uncharacterized protein n=1 Tax=Phaedon cochleariae TaxID=80249 RepID=A0A9N9SGP8_PHACE|nr:unnamed protein product [Phaedon cochleariae]
MRKYGLKFGALNFLLKKCNDHSSSRSRPGRPPKRAPVGLSLAASHLQHHQLKKQRLDNGDYPYENGHMGVVNIRVGMKASHKAMLVDDSSSIIRQPERFLVMKVADRRSMVCRREPDAPRGEQHRNRNWSNVCFNIRDWIKRKDKER